jgi:ribosome-binding factor A
MHKETRKTRRVSTLIQQMLGEILLEDLRDPRIQRSGVVSVTAVEVTADLSLARVYLSASSEDERARREMIEGFRSAQRYLRGKLGRRLRLRRVPTLEFFLDETQRRAERIEQILSEVITSPATDSNSTVSAPAHPTFDAESDAEPNKPHEGKNES